MNTAQLPAAYEELLKEGEEIVIEENTRYFLHNKESIWFVKKNDGDVYAWEQKTENFVPIFLQNCLEGDLIFGTPALAGDRVFFLISLKKVILQKIPFSRVMSLIAKDIEFRQWFTDKVEHWAGGLLSLFVFEPPEENAVEERELAPHLELPVGSITRLKHDIDPYQKRKLLWLACEEGEIDIGGYPPLALKKINSYFLFTIISASLP